MATEHSGAELRSAGLRAPDAAWFAATVSCNAACPVGTDAAGYVQAIGAGRLADAYDLARAHNPFPSVCGRVCSAPCERACRRGVLDAPVAIRALKRVVSEHFGSESPDASRWHLAHGPVPRATRPSVGIVGAGPAGLAAAHDLRLAGHAVTLYERDHEAGGMLLTGIPAFRLARDVVRAEIAALLSLGIELVTDCRIGEQVTLDLLLARHAAVLVTVGCAKGRALPLPGADLPGVIRAVDGLRAINAGAFGDMIAPVVVIGGGSVAFDAARSATRTGTLASPTTSPSAQTALDAARAASRATTCPVLLVAPEPTDALPVPKDELHEAAQEGVTVRAGVGVRRIVGDERVEGVVIAPIASLYDEHGRFRPTLLDGHDETIPARTVILAIGQESDVSFLPAALGLPSVSWGGVRADRDGRTANPRLFAAGDVSTGPRDLIDAIASGQRAARAIRADLSCAASWMPTPPEASTGTSAPPASLSQPRATAATPHSMIGDDAGNDAPYAAAPPVVVPLRTDRRYYSGYDTLGRRELPVLPPDARAQDNEVERMLALVDARTEASRCLRCDTHIVLDASRCIACGLCVDVCPYATLALVAQPLHGAQTFALTLDERACIRCGLCVDRCPTHALELAHV